MIDQWKKNRLLVGNFGENAVGFTHISTKVARPNKKPKNVVLATKNNNRFQTTELTCKLNIIRAKHDTSWWPRERHRKQSGTLQHTPPSHAHKSTIPLTYAVPFLAEKFYKKPK